MSLRIEIQKPFTQASKESQEAWGKRVTALLRRARGWKVVGFTVDADTREARILIKDVRMRKPYQSLHKMLKRSRDLNKVIIRCGPPDLLQVVYPREAMH